MTPIVFASLEEVRLRPRFNETAILTVENYSAPIGPVRFHERYPGLCQLLRKRGPCRKKFHVDGWLVVTKEGVECLLGGCCARKRFPNEQFRRDSRAMEAEIERIDLEGRLAALLTPEFSQRMNDLEDRLNAVRDAMSAMRTAVPFLIRSKLERAAGPGQLGTSFRVGYEDEDPRDPTKTIVKWEERSGGPVAGLACWDDGALAAPYRDIAETRRAFGSTLVGPPNQLKNRVARLESLHTIDNRVQRLERALSQFRDPENLTRASLLSTQKSDKLAMAKLALEAAGRAATDAAANAHIESFRALLSSQFGNRDIRFI